MLKEHLEAKHTRGGSKCEFCLKRIFSEGALIVHKARYHGGEWPFKCPLCGKGAQSSPFLDHHVRTVHGGNQTDKTTNKKTDLPPIAIPSFLQCDQCPLTFPSRKRLNRHKNSEHKGLGRFICETCGKSLKGQVSLKVHMKSHSGIKSEICDVCGKSFVSIQTLRSHKLLHSKEKRYKCHICPKSYFQPKSLDNHFKSHKKKGSWVEPEKKLSFSVPSTEK